MHRRPDLRSLLVVAVVVVAACDGSAAAQETKPRKPTPSLSAAPAGSPHSSCDPIAGRAGTCPLPFPNDWFTMRDRSTETGLRVALATGDMPKNKDGVPIDVTEQNRNDGFSPGAALLVSMPGVDLAKSGAAPITDIGASLARHAPIVVVDTVTGKRHPYWAELDANVKPGEQPLLLVRPAANWIEGHHYVVAVRRMRDATGKPLVPGANFKLLRDRRPTRDPVLRARRRALDRTTASLARAGVARRDLQLAWDFTIASGRNLSERVLHMRDDAFAALGDQAPEFEVLTSTDATEGSLLRTVTGTFEVPKYLTGTGVAGSTLNNGSGAADPLPKRNGTWTANFVCTIPRTAIGADGTANPTRGSLYGHGLLGEATQVRGVGPNYARHTNTTFCATDWIGLSSSDIANAIGALQDLSKFRSMADRMQQGILDFLFLGRLMKSEAGFTTDPAFQDASGEGLLDHRNLVFVGLSQGGIMGGATTAVAQDWDRALLGVPGANYSLLLNRSVDFDIYGSILIPSYPSAADRQIGLQLIQMLWDRGENNGYAQHFTRRPYEGTRRKQIMLLENFGDHQVANISTEVLARTMGAKLRAPGLRAGRDTAKVPFWNVAPVRRLPSEGGSFLVMWDFGTPAPPTANLPNRGGEDPHSKGRNQDDVLAMNATFLDTGTLIDVCDAGPCFTLDG